MTPPDTRTSPPTSGGERAMLDGLLDHHRETLLWKCAGLSHEQLTRRLPTSTLSLLGLLRHLTDVERGWFFDVLDFRPAPPVYPGEFDDLDGVPADEVLARYRSEVDGIRRDVAAVPLDFEYVHREKTYSLRWVYLHMIEEYARHNGHADLLREAIDGVVGE
jgi:hypothetical protein